MFCVVVADKLIVMLVEIVINNFNKQILKREWPKNWQSFIPDIVGASKTNESMCQNNMVILKLLSEEVFDFSTGQMTQTKAKHLKDTMCSQFQQVFLLCIFVMVSRGVITILEHGWCEINSLSVNNVEVGA